jgi:hypothetical protein
VAIERSPETLTCVSSTATTTSGSMAGRCRRWLPPCLALVPPPRAPAPPRAVCPAAISSRSWVSIIADTWRWRVDCPDPASSRTSAAPPPAPVPGGCTATAAAIEAVSARNIVSPSPRSPLRPSPPRAGHGCNEEVLLAQHRRSSAAVATPWLMPLPLPRTAAQPPLRPPPIPPPAARQATVHHIATRGYSSVCAYPRLLHSVAGCASRPLATHEHTAN